MKLSDLIQGGSAEQQKKKLIALYSIIVTMVVLVVLIVALCVTSIVLNGKSNGEEPSTDTGVEDEDSSSGIPSGYVETTFDASQLYSGSLILVNESNPVNAASNISYENIANAPSRAKKESGDIIYSIANINSFEATPDSIKALNQMMLDYYTSSNDDNAIISNAYAEGSTSPSSIFASGTTFEFKYYASSDLSTKAGIYGVTKYNWIYENAHKYGFINLAEESADNAEPKNANLFRYVGVAHATAMKQKKLTTLESYLNYLKADTSVSKALSVSTAEGKMRIYYCAADATAYVSEKNVWEVSGNNVDGYIITVNTSVQAKDTADTTQAE